VFDHVSPFITVPEEVMTHLLEWDDSFESIPLYLQNSKDLFSHEFEINKPGDLKEQWSIWIFRTDRVLDHVPSWEIKQMSADLWSWLRN
jgi:hypothetical protein